MQNVCALVGEATGSFTRVDKGHEENKYNITENSSHPSILRNPYSRCKQTAPGAVLSARIKWTLPYPCEDYQALVACWAGRVFALSL